MEDGKFHDLWRTAICDWFAQGLSEFEVMKLAGHADFRTTHIFYLCIKDDLVELARQITARGLSQDLVQNWCSARLNPYNEKRPTAISNCQP